MMRAAKEHLLRQTLGKPIFSSVSLLAGTFAETLVDIFNCTASSRRTGVLQVSFQKSIMYFARNIDLLNSNDNYLTTRSLIK